MGFFYFSSKDAQFALRLFLAAIPNMKLVMEKNSGEKKTRHPDSERVGAWAIIQHAKLGRLESENSESKNLS
jgi:hypothetical protein